MLKLAGSYWSLVGGRRAGFWREEEKKQAGWGEVWAVRRVELAGSGCRESSKSHLPWKRHSSELYNHSKKKALSPPFFRCGN